MLLKQSQVKLMLGSLLLCFCFSIILIFYVLTSQCNTSSIQSDCSCGDNKSHKHVDTRDTPTNESSDHKLCIIVPFRDRFEELLQFAPYIKTFLHNQKVHNEIWVINQADQWRFNRAYLINVGFRESSPSCDYIAMHDVDLLPQNPALQYKFPEKGPLHISSNELHPKYDYPTFIGGILLISWKHYKLVDGMSNKYWGWGLEDDEFFVRMRQANFVIEKPKGIRSGRSGTFRHLHSSKDRKRDNAKCYNQRNATRRRDRQTGLSTTFYKVASKKELVLDGAAFNFLDIHLDCDKDLTPWCNCTGAPPDKNPPDRSRDEDVVVPLIHKKKKSSS